MRWRVGVSVCCAATLAVAGCGAGGGSASSGDADGRVSVVASTNVWGSVASAVGGTHVDVRSVIDDPSVDPHSYQANAEDAADVQSGRVLLYNGGGYDDFFSQLAERAPDASEIVAVELAKSGPLSQDQHSRTQESAGQESGHTHGDGHDHASFNEHVWYDPQVVSAVTDRLARELGDAAPQHREAFRTNAEEFTARLDEISAEIEQLAEQHGGERVLATAPLTHHLLTAAELENSTPHEFTAAVENQTDIPVAVQQQMLELASGDQVRALVRNVQTGTPATEKIVEAARGAGLPVVDATETLPQGKSDYIPWMKGQVDALSGALAG